MVIFDGLMESWKIKVLQPLDISLALQRIIRRRTDRGRWMARFSVFLFCGQKAWDTKEGVEKKMRKKNSWQRTGGGWGILHGIYIQYIYIWTG